MKGGDKKKKRKATSDAAERPQKKMKLATIGVESDSHSQHKKMSKTVYSNVATSAVNNGSGKNHNGASLSVAAGVSYVSKKSGKSSVALKVETVGTGGKLVKSDSKTEVGNFGNQPSGTVKSVAPSKFGGLSCNWNDLLKSGKVKYKKKTGPSVASTTSSEAKPNEIWFDDVDEVLLDTPKQSTNINDNALVKNNSFEGLTKIIGMDCEMVGIGEDGKDSILARVSIVNHFGHCIYDTFVKPTEKVTDYRTHVSGVRPADLSNATDFKTVQKKVADLLNGRILVGHAVHNDLRVLFLSHPRKDTRDTSTYKPFREMVPGGRPSLKKLTAKLLGVEVQQGEHSSIQDAQAAMRLYTLHRKEWEKSLKMRFQVKRKSKKLKTDKRTVRSSTSDLNT